MGSWIVEQVLSWLVPSYVHVVVVLLTVLFVPIVRRHLKQQDITRSYRKLLSAVLQFTDRLVSGNRNAVESAAPQPQLAWSIGQFELALKLATFLPLTFLLAQWAWSGATIQLDGITILPGNGNIAQRSLTLVAVFGCCAVLIPYSHHAVFPPRRGAREVKVPVLALGLIALIAMMLWTAAVEGAQLAGFAVALSAAVFISGTAAIAVGIIVATGANVVALVGVIVAIFIYKFVVGVLPARFKAWAGMPYLFALFLILLHYSASVVRTSYEMRMFILFGFLPIIVAMVNFLSFGATRWLVYLALKNEGRSIAFYTLIDLIMSVLLSALMATIAVFSYSIGRDLHGMPLLDVRQALLDFQSRPDNSVWLIATLSSTLLPSLANSTAWVFTAAFRLAPWLWNWTNGLIERRLRPSSWGASWAEDMLVYGYCYFAFLLPIALFLSIIRAGQALGIHAGTTIIKTLLVVSNYAAAIGGTS